MKHWRSALDQIYDYRANRAPPAYVTRTDTEKALQDALKQLELQCKERIDILEALRVSRYEDVSSSSSKLSKRGTRARHDSSCDVLRVITPCSPSTSIGW
jgi:fidgetin-like protein 1